MRFGRNQYVTKTKALRVLPEIYFEVNKQLTPSLN